MSDTPDKQHQLANIHGLSQRLNLPTEWLLTEAKAGRIPCLTIGRKRRFNIEAVRAALAEQAAQFPATDMPPEQEWPTALVEFARLMAKKLREKAAAREGWAGESFEHLVGRLHGELADLHVAMATEAAPEIVMREAADVANFCMMIATEYHPGWAKEG